MKNLTLTLKLVLNIGIFCFLPVLSLAQGSNFVPTQHEADSLKAILGTTNNDTVKMEIYKYLAFYAVEHNAKKELADSLYYYNEQEIVLAKKLKQKIWEGEALQFQCWINLGRNYPKALKALNDAVIIAENEENEKNMFIDPYKIKFATPHTVRLSLLAFLQLQYAYTHSMAGNHIKAIPFISKALEISENIKDDVGLSVFNAELAREYFILGSLDSALIYYNKSVAYSNKSGFKILLGSVLSSMAELYTMKKDYNRAKHYFFESIKVNQELNLPSREAGSYLYMTKIFKETKQPDSTIFYVKKALSLFQNFNNTDAMAESYRLISEAYKLKDNTDSAYKYLKLSTTWKDSLNRLELTNLNQYQDFYLEEQKKVKDLEKAKIQLESSYKLYALLATLVLFSMIGLYLYRNNQQKQKANIFLQSQKNEIEHQKTKVEHTLAELKETQAQLIEKEQIASAAAVRLQELDTLKTRLYTNITHEFRTPLTVILGMAQQIKDKPTEFMSEGLGMIKRNGQNLLNLVNQMLDLSKLESGKLTLHYQRSDVVTFMKYLVESFHSYAQSKEVKIHFISDLEQLTMDFDETYLQQIVSNLLTNAVKFTPKGGDIYVSLGIQSTTFSFKVRDTGVGISETNLPLIFDRFYQVDDSTTRHGEGTGIGLSLTRELVKLMEGTISVKSQVNKGTEFEVILPIQHIENLKIVHEMPLQTEIMAMDTTVSEEEKPISKDTHNAEKPLILIADDNADVRIYIASCLGTDYNLIIAKDGQECENLAFEHTPDMIVSDVMMPFKDGFEVCKTLKTDERTSHIPIIMLTAKADMDSKLQGLEHGADVYLMKPFNKNELLLRIKKLLELRLQLQQYYRSTMDSKAVYTEGGNLQAVKKNNPLVNNADNAFVVKVRMLIEANLANANFDVEKLCQDLLLSPSQVHRKLTALTGLSTNNFMRYVRLMKAKEELIKNAHFSIAAVAYDCGFNDPAYFSRAFKQEFGMTPQAWREQNVT